MPEFPRFPWSTILLPLGVGLIVVGMCDTLYHREANLIEKNLRDSEFRRVEIRSQLYEKEIQSVVMELRVLADGDGLTSYLASHQQADLDRAIHRAVFLSRFQPNYDQIRYLDEHGQEVVRVNANGTVVPRDQLQNKADRPYFQKTMALGPGQIYISSFDLNVEHGRIEQPPKSTLRLAMPVFDSAGHRRGIYIINYLGGSLLTYLQQFTSQYQQRFRMLNAQGYWLKAAQPELEWGFMFPDRVEMTLARTDPELWAQMGREPEGQARHAGGLFTWHRIASRDSVGGRSSNTVVADDEFLVMASEVSAAEWTSLFADLRLIFITIAVVLLLLIMASWRFFLARVRTEETLRQSEALSRLMVENVKDYAIIMLDSGGYITRWNAGAERIKGYRAKEIIGQHFSLFYPKTSVRSGFPKKELQEAMAKGRFEDNGWRVRKDGSQFWANVIITAIRDKSDHLLGFVKVTRDLTERKQAEEEVRKLNEESKSRADQLEVANKELEAFSYSVSHDLRAPLRHVDGFVEMLIKHSSEKLDEKGRRYLNIIANSARQMGALIDDLLVFSRMGRTEMRHTEVDLNGLIQETLDAMKMDTKDRHITWKIHPLPEVKADAALMRQVWMNLIANAVKYTRPRDPAEIEIGYSEPTHDDYIFFIRDNGVGFDMQYVNKLFDVFQRLHRADEFEGTGIGLANVQRIILRHGGRTWAEGKIDAGATFFFSLPKNPTQPKE